MQDVMKLVTYYTVITYTVITLSEIKADNDWMLSSKQMKIWLVIHSNKGCM